MAKLKKLLTPRVTMALFGLAVLLLLMSSVGGTRAALTYFSDDYTAEVEMRDIGVTLLENGAAVSHRNYVQNSESWDEVTGELLGSMLRDGEKLRLGAAYPEALAVQNTGTIPQYVRLTLYKYWVNADGQKDRTLDPSLIELHPAENSGWTEDTDSRTEERSVFYYPGVLAPGQTTPALTDTLTISADVQATVSRTQDGNKIVTTYSYDDMQFVIEAQVDAVQDRHFEDAAVSAWGHNG